MKRRAGLSASMSPAEFDNGYWYATELKAFAQSLGIASAHGLRKDELERHVRRFLETGAVPTVQPTRRHSGPRDVDRGLRLDLPVAVYTNDRETKEFLENEARRMAPGHRQKSGARYRLNRWRDDRLARGAAITYRDLVREYVRLCRTVGPFAQVPHGRYINFLSDFLKAEKGATHARARAAWKELKGLDAPKDYRSWKRARAAD